MKTANVLTLMAFESTPDNYNKKGNNQEVVISKIKSIVRT